MKRLDGEELARLDADLVRILMANPCGKLHGRECTNCAATYDKAIAVVREANARSAQNSSGG